MWVGCVLDEADVLHEALGSHSLVFKIFGLRGGRKIQKMLNSYICGIKFESSTEVWTEETRASVLSVYSEPRAVLRSDASLKLSSESKKKERCWDKAILSPCEGFCWALSLNWMPPKNTRLIMWLPERRGFHVFPTWIKASAITNSLIDRQLKGGVGRREERGERREEGVIGSHWNELACQRH